MISAEGPAKDKVEDTIDDIAKRLALKGPLAKLRWVKVSQHEAPNIAAAAESDVVFGVRSTDDIVKAQNRKTK